MDTLEDTVSGLERLSQLDNVKVNHVRAGFSTYKEHTILTEHDEVLFNLKDDRNRWIRTEFKLDGVDNTGKNVFSLRRDNLSWSGKVKLYVNNTLVVIIRRKVPSMKLVIIINNANDEPILKIKGNACNNFELKVQRTNNSDIGSIVKKFRGLCKEIFTTKDNYTITFAKDLEACYKLAIICTCILIDYRFK